MIDSFLIKACKQGRHKAQKDLYDRLAVPMYRLCLRYIHDRQDAEDVMLEAFNRMFQKISQFEYRQPGGFEAWVKRIMVNQCLMFLRKKRPLFLEDRGEEIPAAFASGHPHLLEAEYLFELIRTLPQGYKTIFNLYAIEGYSHKEIAQLLKISEGTSKSQLSRARSWLQSHLTSQAS